MRPDARSTNNEVIPLTGRALIGGLLLLLIRGLALWLLIPMACLVWPLWTALDRSGPTLGQVIGWADWNFMVAPQMTVLRPFFWKDRIARWVPVRDVSRVVHRVGFFDLF